MHAAIELGARRWSESAGGVVLGGRLRKMSREEVLLGKPVNQYAVQKQAT